MKRFLLLISICLTGMSAHSQSKGDYRTDFEQGNLLILEQNYSTALTYFLDAYKIDSTSANINYKVGLCYLKSATEKRKALKNWNRGVYRLTKYSLLTLLVLGIVYL